MGERSPEKPETKKKTPEARAEVRLGTDIKLLDKTLDLTPDLTKLMLDKAPELKKEYDKIKEKITPKVEKGKNKAIQERYEDIYKDIKDDTFEIGILNPLQDTQENAEFMHVLGDMLGLTLKRLKEANPEMDDTLLKRSTIFVAVVTLSYIINLIGHESGHARVMKQGGGEAEISYFEKGIGAMTYETKSPRFMSVFHMINKSLAGLNQQTVTSDVARMKSVRRQLEGITRSSHTELPHYVSDIINKFALSTYLLFAGNKYGGNDVVNYLAESQVEIDPQTMLVSSALMSLISGSTIDNVRKIIHYFINPDKKVKNISLKIGEVELFLPEFNYYLTPEGSFYSAAILAGIHDQLVRLEGGIGNIGKYIEVQVYHIELGRYVKISPYAIISKREKGRNEVYRAPTNKPRIGVEVGTDFEVKIGEGAELVGRVGVSDQGFKRSELNPEGSQSKIDGAWHSNQLKTEIFGWLGVKGKF